MLTTQEIQSVELEIMQKIHCFCERHQIRYVMACGTLLGAVRHKGFIPWDNDMDILMPRADFERFLELTKSEPVAKNIYVVHYTTDPCYHYMVARVCDDRTVVDAPYLRETPARLGVWVDIFPMDGVVSKPIHRFVKDICLKFYWGLFRADVYGFAGSRWTWKRPLKKLMIALFPNKNNRNNYRIDKLSMNTYGEMCLGMDHVFECPKGYGGIPLKDIENPILMEYDKYAFYGPNHYEDYLTAYYGDYMKLPPVEDRVGHDFFAQWSSESSGGSGC